MVILDPTVLGAIIAAAITAILSLLGLIISKEQKVSEFRQQWIDSLRNEVSALLGCTESVIQHARAIKKDVSSKSTTSVNNAELFEKIKDDVKEAERLYHQIQLRINPKEHENILSVLEEMRQAFQSDGLPPDDELHLLEQKLIKITQSILKEEWTKVKDGEPVFRAAKLVATVLIVVTIIFSVYSATLNFNAADTNTTGV